MSKTIDRQIGHGEVIRPGDWFIRPATGERVTLNAGLIFSLRKPLAQNEEHSLECFRTVMTPTMGKEDFIALQEELQSIHLAELKGMYTPELKARYDLIRAAVSNCPWSLDPEEEGTLRDKVVANPDWANHFSAAPGSTN